jgi:hypothetical protein
MRRIALARADPFAFGSDRLHPLAKCVLVDQGHADGYDCCHRRHRDEQGQHEVRIVSFA